MPTNLRHFLVLSALPVLSIAGDFDAPSSTNQAGIELFRQLASSNTGENLVISPYSIASAFTLACAGADGETRSEIAQTFHFPEKDSALASGFAKLREELGARPVPPKSGSKTKKSDDESSDTVELNTSNRLFAQKGFPFRESFLKAMNDSFDASFETADFHTDVEQSRKRINTWIENQTRNKIRDMMPAGSVDSSTRLVLANALYFKAPWAKSFSEYSTQPRPFHIRGEKKTHDLPTMQSISQRGYVHENGLTVVTLDYLGGDFQCLILIPDRDESIETITIQLTSNQFNLWAQLPDKTHTLIELQLPKFKLEGESISLSTALKALGVKSAFDDPTGSANFDRIAPRQADDYLALSDVHHKTFIALDEDGTEAAAATTIELVTLGISSNPKPEPILVHVDRPFLSRFSIGQPVHACSSVVS